MSQPVKYLEKRNSESEYGELRAIMLEKVQEMSGHLWTDYNLHDPGVTILEQLCYALTDINYRSDYDVENLLVNDDNLIDLHQHGMFTPEEALPCRPLTLMDYQKYLTDIIEEADYVIVKPANFKKTDKKTNQKNSKDDNRFAEQAAEQGLSACLFDIYVKKKEEKIYRLADDIGNMTSNGHNIFSNDYIKQNVIDEFNKVRNIAEDLNEVIFIDTRPCELIASIEIDDSRPAIEIACDIYYKIHKILSGNMEKHDIGTLEEQGEMLARLLTGPLAESGYMDETVLGRIDEKIVLSQIVSDVKNIAGVLNIRSLIIESVDGSIFTDYLPPLSEVSYQLVIPSVLEEMRLNIKIKNKLIKLDPLEFITAFEMFSHNEFHREKSLTHKHEESDRPHARAVITQYTSVQTQFPNVYGINQYGVPPSFSTERKAMALQLKGYMMQFDQIMSDHLAMLDNIKDLFSINSDSISSYKTQALVDDLLPDSENLYIEYPDKEFLSQDENYEDYPERKGRIFDYLLAMNGRDKELYGFEYKNPYFTQNEIMDYILESKCKNLKYAHEISSNRAGAFNYRKKCWGSRNISAFEKYIANVIGVDARCRSFVYPLTSEAMNFCYQGDTGFQLFCSTENPGAEVLGEAIEYFYIDISAYEGRLSEELKEKKKNFTLVPYIKISADMSQVFFESIKTRLTDHENSLSKSILNNGVNLDQYRVGHIGKNKGFDLIFNSPGDKNKQEEWHYIASFNSLNDAFTAVNLLRHYLVKLNLEMEGLHMVEHNLLLPISSSGRIKTEGAENENFYIHQITIILPDWTARFSDSDFRIYTESIIRNECPAHIYVNIHWIKFSEMEEFEVIFKNWLNYKLIGNDFDKLNYLSNQLCEFLQSFNYEEKSKRENYGA